MIKPLLFSAIAISFSLIGCAADTTPEDAAVEATPDVSTESLPYGRCLGTTRVPSCSATFTATSCNTCCRAAGYACGGFRGPISDEFRRGRCTCGN